MLGEQQGTCRCIVRVVFLRWYWVAAVVGCGREKKAYLSNPDKPINEHNNQVILVCNGKFILTISACELEDLFLCSANISPKFVTTLSKTWFQPV